MNPAPSPAVGVYTCSRRIIAVFLVTLSNAHHRAAESIITCSPHERDDALSELRSSADSNSSYMADMCGALCTRKNKQSCTEEHTRACTAHVIYDSRTEYELHIYAMLSLCCMLRAFS